MMTNPVAQTQANLTVTGAVTLMGNVSAGSLILNNDPTNSVYVSPYSHLSVGSGLRIGPLGSLTWTQTSPLYVVSENNAVVTITISSIATNPSDPLTVATALVTQGVPNTITVEQLVSKTRIDYNGITLPNLDRFSELLIVPTSNVAGDTYMVQFYPTTGSSNSTFVGGAGFFNHFIDTGTSTNTLIYSSVPVLGKTGYIYGNKAPGSSLEVDIYGTNRKVDELTLHSEHTSSSWTIHKNGIVAQDTNFGLNTVIGDAYIIVHVKYPSATVIPWNIYMEDLSPAATAGSDAAYSTDQKLYTTNRYVTQNGISLTPGFFNLHIWFETVPAAPGVDVIITIVKR